ncbi:MAG: magnesium/cobalt transporter CorA [Candidatus Omnitrophica bacterium]|nr:magnesium/cobalt transporter CorA [Candidatus Omnitrophota bacterium]
MRLIKNMSKKSGMAPGTLTHVGDKKDTKVNISFFDYDRENITEKSAAVADECAPLKGKKTVSWINVDGVHDAGIIENIGKSFGIHPMVLEDIMNTSQRPKFEDLGDYLFIVIKMIYYRQKSKRVVVEQVSLILGENFVISFQEEEGDVFEAVRDRLKRSKGRVRTEGADFLAYALMDSVIDSYFSVLEGIGESIESLEEKVVSGSRAEDIADIHALKRDMIFLRRSIWPLREVISGILRAESGLVKSSTGLYFRDIYDHTIQVVDTIESFRDFVSGILDIYLSSLSNRMNEVMKVLTIFAAIFIPLTFIAGIYGMNFKYMPELELKWGYFAVLGFMALVGVGMLAYFKRKKWF